jgi:hypothetical protein
MTLYQWLKDQNIKPQSLTGKRINLLKYAEGQKRPTLTGYNYDNMGKVKTIDKYRIIFENGSMWYAGEQIDSEYKSESWKVEILS